MWGDIVHDSGPKDAAPGADVEQSEGNNQKTRTYGCY